ncbi:MAG: lipase family protein [Polyangiaceae bacterium]
MRGRLALLSLVVSILGCSSSDEEPTKQVPTLEPGGCGLSYDWLPRTQVGSVVSSSELAETRSAPVVDTLLSLAGLSALTPSPYGAQVFTLRYTTQDKGQRVEATGMVAVPWNEDAPAFDAPVLLELHGTSGFSGPCAPSAPATQHDYALALTILASRGFVVVAPDFIGLDAADDGTQSPNPRHAYLNAEQVAVGALDMVRAARAMLPKQAAVLARPSKDLYLWGPSQGGHAVFATELYAPYYASEFRVKAAVALVPPTDLVALAEHALSVASPTTVALVGAMVSLDRHYSDGSAVPQLLTDADPTHFATRMPTLMDTDCSPAKEFDGVTDVAEVFQPSALTSAQSKSFDSFAPFGCYALENSFTTTSVKRVSDTPFLFVLGENDDLVYSPVEREDFDRLCAFGYRMEYLECAGADHVQGATWSIPEQVRWLMDRVDGKPLGTLCQRAPAQQCDAQQ